MTFDKDKKTIFSGIQPSGSPHIGNYLGMMKRCVEIQNSEKYNTIFCAVNYHAMTTLHDGSKLRENTRELVIDYLSVGIDPERSLLLVQAENNFHTELSWIFSTLIPIAVLQKMHTFKDKVKNKPEDVNAGVFTYPILMAADILIYDAELVPVGKDQIPHVEFARDIAKKFNHIYEETFKVPKLMLEKETQTILGIDGEKKMSKSLDNHIPIFAKEEEIKKRVMRIITSSDEIGSIDEEKFKDINLFKLLKHFLTNEEFERIKNDFLEGKIGYKESKEALFEGIMQTFRPMREKREKLLKDQSYVDSVIEQGAKLAYEITQEKMKKVRKIVGLD